MVTFQIRKEISVLGLINSGNKIYSLFSSCSTVTGDSIYIEQVNGIPQEAKYFPLKIQTIIHSGRDECDEQAFILSHTKKITHETIVGYRNYLLSYLRLLFGRQAAILLSTTQRGTILAQLVCSSSLAPSHSHCLSFQIQACGNSRFRTGIQTARCFHQAGRHSQVLILHLRRYYE
jgi:hypothetical protein